jgi:hypothetical protein
MRMAKDLLDEAEALRLSFKKRKGERPVRSEHGAIWVGPCELTGTKCVPVLLIAAVLFLKP